MTIKRLIGTDPDQIPRNSDLGSMAFQDAAGVTVGKLKVNTSATLLGSTAGVAAGVYPLNISDGNTIASALTTSDWMVLSAQGTPPGFAGIVAGTSGSRMVFKGVKAAGTLASPTVPANGDEVLSVLGAIYDSSTTLATAQITFKVDGTVSSGVAPQRIEFQTGNTNSRTTRLTIGSTGAITAAGTLTVNDITAINANSASTALTINQSGAGNRVTTGITTIDNIGRVLVGGATTARDIGITPIVQVEGPSSSYSTILIARNSADTSQPSLRFVKSRGTTTGSLTAVQNNDTLGSIFFVGTDGANHIGGASISAWVDGTPGTNDLPTRLTFHTCADGSASDLERMRIDNAGAVGIGDTTLTGYRLKVGGTIPNASSGYSIGIASVNTFNPAVATVAGYNYLSSPSVSTGTLADLRHYQAQQGTFTGTVTNQYGFYVSSGVNGATNNFGFYSALAAGTNRWNFYSQGDAQNYFSGNTGIGGLPSGTYKLEVTGDAYISGNLTVNGATTTINSTTISVDDKNIELGSVATPTDITADGGGITLKGTTDKTINWVNATGAWTSSEDFNLLSGKTYEINGALVLSATTLGSGVVNSSLTSVGTLTGLSVSGTILVGNLSNNRLRITESGGELYIQSGNGTGGTGALIKFAKYASTTPVLTVDITNSKVGIGSSAGTPGATLDVQGDVIIEASRFDTTTTAISTTTQTEVASYAAATYRTAEFLVQIVDSTNSQYHSAKILVIHNGATVNVVQYGVVHTADELGTFDADISGGNVRLLFTASAATTKTVKVLATMLTA